MRRVEGEEDYEETLDPCHHQARSFAENDNATMTRMSTTKTRRPSQQEMRKPDETPGTPDRSSASWNSMPKASLPTSTQKEEEENNLDQSNRNNSHEVTGTTSIEQVIPSSKGSEENDNGEASIQDVQEEPTGHPSFHSSSSCQNQNMNASLLECPISRQPFQDPIVASDGRTYERTAWEREPLNQDPIYPNRSLQRILEEQQQQQQQQQLPSPVREGKADFLRGFSPTVPSMLRRQEVGPPPLPNDYFCSITLELMHIPVIDPEGNTFEKAAILYWIRIHQASPLTRTPLRADQLYPNQIIADLLWQETKKPNHAIHPTIQRWKEQEPPIMIEEGMNSEEHMNRVPDFPSTHEELLRRARLRRHESPRRDGTLSCLRLLVWMTIILMVIFFVPGGLYIAFALCFIARVPLQLLRRNDID